MKVVEASDLERIDDMAGDHPHITKPTENQEDREYFLLKDGEDIVGCGYIRVFLEKLGNIGSVFIVEDRRGDGAGTFFVGELEDRLEEKGVSLCIIGVHSGNKSAKKFWEKTGYHVLVQSIGDDVFESETFRKVLQVVSPKPVPENGVTIMGKRFGSSDDENTHPLKELYDLKDFVGSLETGF